VWDSDFYRLSSTVRRRQNKIYDFDDCYNRKYSSKIKIARFDPSVLDEFKKLNIDKNNCRNRLTLPQDRIIVTVQEYLYAENIVITGDWLPYDTLDERGVFMLKVSSVEEVGENWCMQ